MATIMFSFHDHVDEPRREALLEELRATKGVQAAGRLRPDAVLPSMRHLGYAEIAAQADDTDAKHFLEAMPEIELVSVPTRGVA